MKYKTIPLIHYSKRLRNYKKAQHYLLMNSEAYTHLDQKIVELEKEIEALKLHNTKMRVWNHRAKNRRKK